MYKLLEFIRSTYVVFLFVAIEAIAASYYARSSYYTQARMLARANRIAGGVNGWVADAKHYFSLGAENRELLARVGALETELSRYRRAETQALLDEYVAGERKAPYEFVAASVVANSINKDRNFLVFDRGRRNGVLPGMAVLSPGGAMVGYVAECSERYAVAVSVLNTAFRASGRIADTDYFGSISWDGTDPQRVTMVELSKYASPRPGDEVVTTGFSLYFPSDILIGTVASSEMNEGRTAYTVTVRLAADFSALSNVILVRNTDLGEVRGLEQSDKVKEVLRRR